MTSHALRAALLLSAVAFTARAQSIDFTNYHSPAQIDAEMDKLKTSFPDLVKIDTIGTSLEGRPIKAIHISSSTLPDAGKGDAVFVGLHHAREWISVETALAVAERICQMYNSTAQLKADVDRLNIWVVPVLNPDGYVYTRDHDRLWRKNRRLNDNGSHGVDLNRNYYFFWGLPDGSSSSPYDDTYSGPWAFSEPETQTIAAFLVDRQNLKFFITYHSFAELFLRPWSYTHDDPPGEQSLHSVVEREIDIIHSISDQTYGQDLYLMSGEATDFVWQWLRASPHTIELRPKPDTSTTAITGFAPPASTIMLSNEENIPAAFAMLHDAAAREVWMRDYVGDPGDEPSAKLTNTTWSHPIWESPDITSGVTNIIAGNTVPIIVHVNNNTGAAVNNVTVEAYFDDSGQLEVPTLTSILMGSQTVNVPAGGTDVLFNWTVPLHGNSYGTFTWNVGAVVKEKHDMPLTTKVERSSNVAMRTFNVGIPIPRRSDLVFVSNFAAIAAELQLAADSSLLAKGWRVRVIEVPRKYPPIKAPIPRSSSSLAGMERKARLLGAKGTLLGPGETASFVVQVEPPADAKPGTTQDIRIASTLRPLVAGKRPVTAGGYTIRYVVP
jgi:hypothetical protein